MEARFAAGQLDRLPGLAVELVALQVDVIAVIGAVTFSAARRATSDIPIVFTIVLPNLNRAATEAEGLWHMCETVRSEPPS
jgi:hypothetical protein